MIGNLYNLSTKVQENTLLNRGILDLGGVGIPQAAMSNNKTEALERGVQSGLYFVASFLTPFILLPFFNKRFLSSSGIVKEFKGNEKMIIEVPKRYLTKGKDYLIQGIRETAQVIKTDKLRKQADPTEAFETIIKRYKGKEGELFNKLTKVHEKVLFWDLLTTCWMWVSIPWTITEGSKLFTKRDDFSAVHKMKKEDKVDEDKLKKDKQKRFALTALIATLPAFLVSKSATKAITAKSGNLIKKYADNFNYTRGMFISKTLFALIWALADYPSSLISARDKYERRDRSIRYGGMMVAYFAVDPIVNHGLGWVSDKFLGTQVLNKGKFRGLREIGDLEGLSPKVLRRTKIAGAGIYWTGILAAVAALGFGLPAFLNAMLKKEIRKEKTQKIDKRGFEKFGF